VLFVRYRLANASTTRALGKLFVAARPFQVNPPWQTFTIHGGVSRVDSIRGGDRISINDRSVIPLTMPASFGASTFDQGDVTTLQAHNSGRGRGTEDAARPLKLLNTAAEFRRPGILPGRRLCLGPA